MDNQFYDVCIIGTGISGLSTAAFLLDQQPDLRILMLEKADQSGGAISSYHQDGFLAEWGPHGFLDNCEASRELIRFASLEGELETTPLSEFVRYVCLDGKLQCIPQTPLRILRQPLISVPAKLRVLADLWRKPMPGSPSVAQWVEYRFGKALLPFADAVFTGTYAGDINKLKIDAVMPGVRGLEQQDGSVIRGVIKKMLAKRKGGHKRKGMPAMTSFKEGMGRLPQRLSEKIGDKATILYNTEATSLTKTDDQWQVTTGAAAYNCADLVVALPVNAGLPLLRQSQPLQPPLSSLPEARIVSVILGFTEEAQVPFGFGYLAPEKEERFSLGTLFSSHMFPGRAPQGHQIMEVLVGGRRHEKRLLLSDNELINHVYQDIRQIMDLPKAPCFSKVLRSPYGIPQLESGYTDLLAWRERVMQGEPNLHICGFGWKGIGINDMTTEGRKMAQRIITRQEQGDSAEVKGVYF